MKPLSSSENNLRDKSAGWIAISSGNLNWQIHHDFNKPELFRRLSYLEKSIEQAEPLRKDTRQRNTFVARIEWPECHSQPLVLKRYRPLTLWRSFKDSRHSRAIAAFEKAFCLERQKISTALPIAASQSRWQFGRAESYLITEMVSNARSLREFRRGNFSANENKIVIRRLAEAIAGLHNAGFSHSDPTLSNFFVCDDEFTSFRIILIDLDGLRVVQNISGKNIAEDLSRLFRRIPMSPREKLWFAAQYSRSSQNKIASRKLLSLLAERNVADSKKARPTQFLQCGKIRWQGRRGVLHSKVLAVMNDPESFLQNDELFFKNSRIVTVARVPASVAVEPSLVLRRLKYGKLGHQIKDSFRPSRTRRALQYGLMLEQNGIATPRAFAAAEVRQLRWPMVAYLITEEIPNAKTLARFLTEPPIAHRVLAQRLADLLARMHNKGFSHRDLKSSNILLDGDLKPFLIDLDGLQVWKKITTQRAVADLARLARGISNHERKLRFVQWRFLKRYCQQREPALCVREMSAQIGRKLRD